jgi:hypothetical protein
VEVEEVKEVEEVEEWKDGGGRQAALLFAARVVAKPSLASHRDPGSPCYFRFFGAACSASFDRISL